MTILMIIMIVIMMKIIMINIYTAQQEAQRAAFIVEKAKQDKQSTIVRAEGEARSAELIGKAMMNNPGYLQLRKIEQAREIAAIVAQSKNRVFLDAETLLLNVQDQEANEKMEQKAMHAPVAK
jgi:prohibitin 2